MAYWLLKTEPTCYSWEQFTKDRKTVWDGITNNAALLHLRSMKKGDSAFFYHTGFARHDQIRPCLRRVGPAADQSVVGRPDPTGHVEAGAPACKGMKSPAERIE